MSELSFWERSVLFNQDVVIIGGGITGLSIAASIKERAPHRQVCVLDRSMFPYGASTRNAGFACFGSLTELAADVRNMGSDAARELLFNRWMGLKITRKRLGDAACGFRADGGYELTTRDIAASMVGELNPLVEDFLPDYFQIKAPGSVPGLKLDESETVVEMRGEGQLNTGMLMQALESHCAQLGVIVRGGAEVLNAERVGDFYKLRVADSLRGQQELNANCCIVATNAFSSAFGVEGVVPGRGQVLITAPIPGLKFRGSLHIDEGFYYLRNVEDRVLIGGGRNLQMEGETTESFGLNNEIQEAIETVMHRVLEIPDEVEVDMRWSGIMAFGESKAPLIRLDDDGIIYAVKMSGMGIALSAQVGEIVMDMIEEYEL